MVHKSNEAVKKQSLKTVATSDGKGKVGHNSKGTVKQTVAEIEELTLRQRELGKVIREKKAHLKEQGVNTMALNQVLRERRMESDVRANFYEDCHIVRDSLGMQLSLFEKARHEEGKRGLTEAEIDEVQEKTKAGEKAAPAKAKAKDEPKAEAKKGDEPKDPAEKTKPAGVVNPNLPAIGTGAAAKDTKSGASVAAAKAAGK